MNITPAEREQVATELKHFAKDLNLKDQQKEKLQVAPGDAREKVGEFLKKNPNLNLSKTEIVSKIKAHRAEIRTRIAGLLSPEQLGKWDNEVAKAKEFLGQRMEA